MGLTFFEDGRKPSIIEYGAIIWFNLWLVSSIIIVYVLCILSLTPFGIWPESVQLNISATLRRCCRFFWRWPFIMSPWIRIETRGISNSRGLVGSSGRPVLILANHTSYLDTILFTAYIHYSTIANVITLASSALFNIKLLGTVIRSAGHIAVHFKEFQTDQNFAIDPEKRTLMIQKMQRHAALGGWIAMYPEGQIHRGGFGSQNTATLQSFRVGGLKLALEHDMEIWAWVTRGNNDCWPRTAVGGLPATIKGQLAPIAPSGSRQLLRTLDPRAVATDLNNDRMMELLPKFVSHVQTNMQALLDELYNEGKGA